MFKFHKEKHNIFYQYLLFKIETEMFHFLLIIAETIVEAYSQCVFDS